MYLISISLTCILLSDIMCIETATRNPVKQRTRRSPPMNVLQRIAYIMHGMPGTGKSPLAKELAGVQGKVFSTSDLFVADGVYRFAATRLERYQQQNFTNFCSAMDQRARVVVCDNTNSMPWEWQRYETAAKVRSYKVVHIWMPFIDPAYASTGRHNVPVESCRAIADRLRIHMAAHSIQPNSHLFAKS